MTVHKEIAIVPLRYFKCDRFTFGVPLEDIFYRGQIHPQLKDLFEKLYYVLRRERNLEQILTSHQEQEVSVAHLDTVKDLELCRNLDHIPVDDLIWCLKYFLECLPIPVLPLYTNGQHFDWKTLSIDCKACFNTRKGTNSYMSQKIINNLVRLPSANLILIEYLFTFLYKLCKSRRQLTLKSTTLRVVVQYFGSVLFQRPFKLWNSEPTLTYHPLLYYIITNWKILNNALTKQYYGPKILLHDVLPQHNLIDFKDKGTQTTLQHQERIHRLETIYDDVVLETFPTCPFSISSPKNVVDSVCQTDPIYSKVSTSEKSCSTDWSSTPSVQAISQFTQVVDEEFYYSTVPTIEIPEQSQVDRKTIQTIFNQAITSSACVQSSESNVNPGEYIDDEYEDQNLQSTKFGYESDLCVEENTESLLVKRDTNMMEKLAKFGWTYTPGSSSSNNCDIVISPRIVKAKPQDYQLCYQTDNGANDTCSTTSSHRSRTLKSLLRVGSSIRIKMDFLKLLRKRRELPPSNSAEQVRSAIKYKKMSSNRSTIF